MMNPKILEGVSEQLAKVMSGAPGLPGEAVRQQVHSILQSSFAKLDLVTRDEFDAQMAVLQRTRALLEAQQARLDALEAQLNPVAEASEAPASDIQPKDA